MSFPTSNMATTTTFTGMGRDFAPTAAANIPRNTQAGMQRQRGFIDCDTKWESGIKVSEQGLGRTAPRLRYTMVEMREEMV